MGARGRKVRTGDSAPDFQLRQFGGEALSLAELRSRGPVFVAFFKAGCPTCQFTFPFLERIAGASPTPFFGISQDDPETTGKFRERLHITFPTLLDSSKESYPASNAFGITSVPTMYLIQPDGRISWHSEGFVKADLEKLGEQVGVKAFHEGEAVPAMKAG